MNKKKREEDQLALLQDNILDDGQITMWHFAPNLELTLYLAQLTGAVIITNSITRFREIARLQKSETSNWQTLIDHIKELELPLNIDVDGIYDLRLHGHLGKMRKAWSILSNTIQMSERVKEEEINKLINELDSAWEATEKEISTLKGELADSMKAYSYKAQFKCIIPDGGIKHTNVERLILTSGIENHLKSVPMAIFLSHAPVPINQTKTNVPIIT